MDKLSKKFKAIYGCPKSGGFVNITRKVAQIETRINEKIKIKWNGIDEKYAHVMVLTKDTAVAILFELDGEENEATINLEELSVASSDATTNGTDAGLKQNKPNP